MNQHRNWNTCLNEFYTMREDRERNHTNVPILINQAPVKLFNPN